MRRRWQSKVGHRLVASRTSPLRCDPHRIRNTCIGTDTRALPRGLPIEEPGFSNWIFGFSGAGASSAGAEGRESGEPNDASGDVGTGATGAGMSGASSKSESSCPRAAPEGGSAAIWRGFAVAPGCCSTSGRGSKLSRFTSSLGVIRLGSRCVNCSNRGATRGVTCCCLTMISGAFRKLEASNCTSPSSGKMMACATSDPARKPRRFVSAFGSGPVSR
jgi:hypothetical protein